MRLSRAQFEALFDGLDWRRVHGRGACARRLRRSDSGVTQGRHKRAPVGGKFVAR